MKDKDKTKEQLINELAAMRQRVAALEALETERQETENALRQRTAELKACYEELNTFARMLSHDLRGALGLIISFAQVLEEYHAMLKGEELRRYLAMIACRGHKMISVIDELLAERTEPPPAREIEIGPLDMASVVAQALEIVDYMVEEHQAEIILPERWPVALGYAPWVEEVWVNYLSNAIEYGGRPPRVELGFSISDFGLRRERSVERFPILDSSLAEETQSKIPNQKSKMVCFWIRDNGPGFAPEEQAQLFKPSAQPDPVHTTGYGLGLVVVRRIVEKLGGRVGVESEGVRGRGSLFYFTLPLAE
jgi:two-component system sensor histidine kinase/response regulator